MARGLLVPFLGGLMVLGLGCTRPDLDMTKLRIGMTKKEVVERVGSPSRVTVTNDTEVHEYEAYERYGAIKINNRSRYVRFTQGKVDAFGSLEDLKAGRAAVTAPSPAVPPVAPPPPAPGFDLRGELEKLERLKKDGLISEAEFKELRQKVMDKARAQ